jgi:hypothetical protein
MISTSVGGLFQIATLTLETGFQKLGKKDIQVLINENQSRFSDLRKVFLDKLG